MWFPLRRQHDCMLNKEILSFMTVVSQEANVKQKREEKQSKRARDAVVKANEGMVIESDDDQQYYVDEVWALA